MNERIEAELIEAIDAGNWERVATVALENFGPEIHSFVGARLRAPSDAEEVFSMFVEDFWRGLPTFERRCSLRGWMYVVARNAANRYVSSPHLRSDRHVSLARIDDREALIARLRTRTATHLQTEMKSRVRALRDRLSAEDQMLLLLHVDRRLPWRELAAVMLDKDPQDTPELDREAARLRKRYERLKVELRALAVKEGLLDG